MSKEINVENLMTEMEDIVVKVGIIGAEPISASSYGNTTHGGDLFNRYNAFPTICGGLPSGFRVKTIYLR
jgi:hypothetical protein